MENEEFLQPHDAGRAHLVVAHPHENHYGDEESERKNHAKKQTAYNPESSRRVVYEIMPWKEVELSAYRPIIFHLNGQGVDTSSLSSSSSFGRSLSFCMIRKQWKSCSFLSRFMSWDIAAREGIIMSGALDNFHAIRLWVVRKHAWNGTLWGWKYLFPVWNACPLFSTFFVFSTQPYAALRQFCCLSCVETKTTCFRLCIFELLDQQ
jgi:hypothetical protein